MPERTWLTGKTRVSTLLIAVLLGAFGVAAGPGSARGECRQQDRKKIASYVKAAMDDFDLLEIDSALKKLQRAIDFAEDKECEKALEYADALLKKGVVHMRGQKDAERCKVFMTKAIKANACVKLEENMPPNVQKLWSELKRQLSSYKCSGGGDEPPPRRDDPPPRRDDPPPPRRDDPPPRREVDFGAAPTKPCEHASIDEATAGEAVQVIVKVQSDLGASKVVVFYRPQGESSYKKLMLARQDNGWAWLGLIPSIDVQGQRLAYFIEVQNAGGTAICAPMKATSGQPEVIMLKAGERRATAGCDELPEEVCKTNPDHPCCKRTTGGGGGGRPKKIRVGGKFPRFYLNLGFALGMGYLAKTFKSDLAKQVPQVAGFALGPIGAGLEFGYFLARRHLLSLGGRFGVAMSDKSQTSVLAWQAHLRYRFFAMGGGPKDIFAFYLGGEVGAAQIYHSLAVGNDNKLDTFSHGFVIIGAVLGIQIGTERVGWYLEVDPLVVLPNQATFHLGLSTGVMLRF